MKPLTFRDELAIEAINSRVTDLRLTLVTRFGMSKLTAEATRAIEVAVAPIIAAILARNEE
jgi:hypothetical protein